MKLAFVTGSNKGLGYGIIKRLAKFYSGEWDIYLTARNVERGQEAVEKLNKEGLSVKFHQLDITVPESRKEFLSYIAKNHPLGINVAVNNAGIAYKVNSTAPFGEQARVTVGTNFTSTVDFTEEFIPLLAANARVVNVTGSIFLPSLKKMNKELYQKIRGPMTISELREFMAEFVKCAEDGTYSDKGWLPNAYAVSKLGLTKASQIFGDMLKSDARRIIFNSCCPGYVNTELTSHKGVKTIDEGADTPFYLATLPPDAQNPINQFVYDRKVIAWCK
ncbi:unnamed protein product [Trichobilharzia szidati]|nr:unnamed protein product [Trichobilharzia szidati]